MEPETELNSTEVKTRAVRGVVLLTARSLGLRALGVIGSVLLARWLAPRDFGVFGVVMFLIGFFQFFSDVGLGAALIQKRETVTRTELSTTFTIQFLLVCLLTSLLFGVSPWLATRYRLTPSSVWLIRVMGLTLFITSFKVIPSILLERRLRYDRFVLIEVVETLTFQSIAVGMAWCGYGIWSLVMATLVRGIAGLAVLYTISPWMPRFSFDREAARGLFRFGLPYQGTMVIGLIRDALTPTIIAIYCGAEALGYLNWASSFAGYVGSVLVQTLWRIGFPVYARLQSDPAAARGAIEKSLRWSCLIYFPILAVQAGLAPSVIRFVFTPKWMPALGAFYLITLGSTLSMMSTLWVGVLNGLGRAGVVFRLNILWTLLTWILTVPLVMKEGFIGAALTGALLAPTAVLPYWELRKIVLFTVWPHVRTATVASVVTLVVCLTLDRLWISNGIELAFSIGTGVVVYLGAVWLIEGKQILLESSGLVRAMRLGEAFG